MSKTITNMERIIAKIDNDFNPDNSDWIPRVAAWTIDAMSMLKVMQEVTTKKTYKVTDRIAYNQCGFDNIVSVYDSNGCPIKELDNEECSCSSFSTGQGLEIETNALIELSSTMSQDENIRQGYDTNIAFETTKGNEPMSHKVVNINYKNTSQTHNYVIVNNNKIELNFDTDCITVVSKGIKTERSATYGCDIPVIPNNGLLIECIAAWCMYKMLCRGYKHPVFNLRDNSPAINPFIFWIQNKDKAKDSVNISEQGDIDSKLWRSAFYIDTFDPRN